MQVILQQIDELIDCEHADLDKPRNISLIGHSQGGLIARLLHNHYKKEPERKINVKTTFILNSPQKGAPILNYINRWTQSPETGAHRDMEHKSDFIKYHNEFCTNNDNLYEIISKNDIIDPKFARLACDEDKCYDSWFGHYFISVNVFFWTRYIAPKLID